MALTIENVRDVSLLGETILLQAHFRSLAEGILTIDRRQTRLDTISGKQQVNVLVHGKKPFELSIDPADWPKIECKVICKIGDASNESAQNLVVANITAVTMSDEDAHTELNSQLGRNRFAKAKMERDKKCCIVSAQNELFRSCARMRGRIKLRWKTSPVGRASSRTQTAACSRVRSQRSWRWGRPSVRWVCVRSSRPPPRSAPRLSWPL